MTNTQSPAPGVVAERDTTKPAEEQGLFRKFNVSRTDGSSEPGGKHEDCEYFVLDIDHDPHAKAALAAYSVAVRATHPALADDMIERYGLSPFDVWKENPYTKVLEKSIADSSLQASAAAEPDDSSQKDQAEAWESVVETLIQIDPNVLQGHGTGLECVLRSIKRLAAPPLPAQVRVDGLAELGVRLPLKVEGVTALENGGLGVVVELPKQIGEMKCWIHDCKTVEQCAESGCALRTPAPGMAGGVGAISLSKDESGVVWLHFNAGQGQQAMLNLNNIIAERRGTFTTRAMEDAINAFPVVAPRPSPAPQAAGAEEPPPDEAYQRKNTELWNLGRSVGK